MPSSLFTFCRSKRPRELPNEVAHDYDRRRHVAIQNSTLAVELTNKEASTVLCSVVKHTGSGWSTKEVYEVFLPTS